MRERKPLLALVVACLCATAIVHGQIKPTAPGTPGDPSWQRTLHLSDGRTFITDGGIAIDAALAKPAALPATTLPASSAKLIESYLAATLKDEVAYSELTRNPNGRTFLSPTGLALNATYVNFLTRILPARTLRFRMESELRPMVIVSNGKPVGVLMGVKQ